MKQLIRKAWEELIDFDPYTSFGMLYAITLASIAAGIILWILFMIPVWFIGGRSGY